MKLTREEFQKYIYSYNNDETFYKTLYLQEKEHPETFHEYCLTLDRKKIYEHRLYVPELQTEAWYPYMKETDLFHDINGNIVLSKKEANDILAWDKLKQMMEGETTVKVRIQESVPSGVVTYLEGIRAFIPASQITLDYVEDTDAWIGKEIEVRVITVDAEKEKLVLSGKAVAREAEAEERNHKISMIVPGTVMEGTVESLMPYGAFINLGNGLSGLVHISQICERRIKKPSEVLKEGQKVKAKVLNTNDNKISLSMKALADNSAEQTEE